MYEKAVSKEIFMLKYCLNRYKTQEISEKADDACLQSLKLVSVLVC